MFNESFFFALACVLFIVLSFKYVKAFLFKLIENRIQSIKDKFDEALLISKESEKLLQKYQDLHYSSEEITKDLAESTKIEIAQLKLRAEQELESKLQHKTEIIASKIRRNEMMLLSKIRSEAIQLAIDTTVSILESHKDKLQDVLINDSVSAFSKKIQDKNPI